jgi:hypothetical protein
MRLQVITATAAAALLSSTMAFAQASGQADVPSAPHQNSAHAASPSKSGEPGYSTGGPRGRAADENAMQNTSGMRDDKMVGDARMNENGAHLRLTTTQRTRIHDVIVRAHGPRLTNVTFRIGVGARIPRTVRVAVLPPEIVAIAPEWQGYSYFEYGDQIVIVDPMTFAIVATLPL